MLSPQVPFELCHILFLLYLLPPDLLCLLTLCLIPGFTTPHFTYCTPLRLFGIRRFYGACVGDACLSVLKLLMQMVVDWRGQIGVVLVVL